MATRSQLETKYFAGPKNFQDPVHGPIRIYRYEEAIINTRPFQRLRGIKQLGACETVWMGATHTRFQHSIGTVAMAQKMLEQLADADVAMTEDRAGAEDRAQLGAAHRVVLRLLALLHDIGHIPFGHTLEDERPVIWEAHDDPARIRRILASEVLTVLSGIESLFNEEERAAVGLAPGQDSFQAVGEVERREGAPSTLAELLIKLITQTKGESSPRASSNGAAGNGYRLFVDIVGDTVCADLLDYLARDTYCTGLRRSYDEKIFDHLVLEEGSVAIDLSRWAEQGEGRGSGGSRTRGGIVNEISNLLRVRYTLAERVYFNYTKAAASGMISKAVELSGISAECLSYLRDDELLDLLEMPGQLSHDIQRELKSREPSSHLESAENDLGVKNGETVLWPRPSESSHNNDQNPGFSACPIADAKRIETFLGKAPAELWKHISSKSSPAPADPKGWARELVRAYRRRNIFRPVWRLQGAEVRGDNRQFLCDHFYEIERSAFRSNVECWLADMAGLWPWQVILYCPKYSMQAKVAETLVGPLKDGKYCRANVIPDTTLKVDYVLKNLSDEIKLLVDLHERLWSMEILVDPDVEQYAKNVVAGCCRELFKWGDPTNSVDPEPSLEQIRRDNLKKAIEKLQLDIPAADHDKYLYEISATGRDVRTMYYTPRDFVAELVIRCQMTFDYGKQQ